MILLSVQVSRFHSKVGYTVEGDQTSTSRLYLIIYVAQSVSDRPSFIILSIEDLFLGIRQR